MYTLYGKCMPYLEDELFRNPNFDKSFFSLLQVQENLHSLLRQHNITIVSTNSFVNDPSNAVQALKVRDDLV